MSPVREFRPVDGRVSEEERVDEEERVGEEKRVGEEGHAGVWAEVWAGVLACWRGRVCGGGSALAWAGVWGWKRGGVGG